MNDHDEEQGRRDATRLKRIAQNSTGGVWEKILHAPWLFGITPAVIDLLEQVIDADGTVDLLGGNQFHCEVGGTRLGVVTGTQPAFNTSSDRYPADPPHLRALADLPVRGGHERDVIRRGPSMTVNVRTPHDGSGSELANAIQEAQDTESALRGAAQKPGAGYDDLVGRLITAGLAVPRIPAALRDQIQTWAPWWWATDQSAQPFEDYLLKSEVLLERPVADHVAITHAGHGINSYSLNWRQAFGPVAFLIQTGWGGGLSGDAAAVGRQAELFSRTSRLTAALEDRGTPMGGVRIRRLLITVSDFRDVLLCRQWNGALTRWEPVPLDGTDPWEHLERLVQAAVEVT